MEEIYILNVYANRNASIIRLGKTELSQCSENKKLNGHGNI